jgi:hypothetical protein
VPICAVLVRFGQQRSLGMVGAAAVVGMLILVAESYFAFGLKDVWILFMRRMRRTEVASPEGA